MQNINNSNSKIPGFIMLFIGIIFTIIAIVAVIVTTYLETKSFNGNEVEIVGKIVDVQYNTNSGKSAIVEYDVDNQKYTVYPNYTSSDFFIGKEMKVIYNRENPREAFVRTSLLFPIVFGGVFGLIGIMMLSISIATFKNKIRWVQVSAGRWVISSEKVNIEDGNDPIQSYKN